MMCWSELSTNDLFHQTKLSSVEHSHVNVQRKLLNRSKFFSFDSNDIFHLLSFYSSAEPKAQVSFSDCPFPSFSLSLSSLALL